MTSSATDADWFTFTTSTAKNVKVSLTNLPANYDIKLYKTPGILVSTSSHPGTESETIIYNNNRSTTYYIHVYGVDGANDPQNLCTLKAATSSTAYKSAGAGFMEDAVINDVTIFPNPASYILYMDISSTAAGVTAMTIVNATCQAVLLREFNVKEGSNHFTLDISTLPDGLYMIRLVINNTIITHKVMILN
jgi:hypothetical protein